MTAGAIRERKRLAKLAKRRVRDRARTRLRRECPKFRARERDRRNEYVARKRQDPEWVAMQRSRDVERKSTPEAKARQKAYDRARYLSDPEASIARGRKSYQAAMANPISRERLRKTWRENGRVRNRTPHRREWSRRFAKDRYDRMGGVGYARHRGRLCMEQAMACGICGHLLGDEKAHVDHIIPVARWPQGLPGIDHVANLQAAHPSCNSSKGDKLMEPVLDAPRIKYRRLILKLEGEL